MLAVRLAADTMKAMTLHNTLKTLPFGRSHYFNAIAYDKNINRDGFAN